jgi:hypothetical protein
MREDQGKVCKLLDKLPKGVVDSNLKIYHLNKSFDPDKMTMPNSDVVGEGGEFYQDLIDKY